MTPTKMSGITYFPSDFPYDGLIWLYHPRTNFFARRAEVAAARNLSISKARTGWPLSLLANLFFFSLSGIYPKAGDGRERWFCLTPMIRARGKLFHGEQ
jgi:hypothetical protein